jgi:hypothetical protein
VNVCSIVRFNYVSTGGLILQYSYGILFKLNSSIFLDTGIFDLYGVYIIRD